MPISLTILTYKMRWFNGPRIPICQLKKELKINV
jgi:hypothetical protein